MTKSMAQLAPLFALGLVAVPVAAQAETASEIPTVAVEYMDLDLTRADHQVKLDRRIARAVTKVCGNTSPRTLSQNADISACRANAKQAAQKGARVAIARAEQQRAFASNQSAIVGN